MENKTNQTFYRNKRKPTKKAIKLREPEPSPKLILPAATKDQNCNSDKDFFKNSRLPGKLKKQKERGLVKISWKTRRLVPFSRNNEKLWKGSLSNNWVARICCCCKVAKNVHRMTSARMLELGDHVDSWLEAHESIDYWGIKIRTSTSTTTTPGQRSKGNLATCRITSRNNEQNMLKDKPK